MRLKRFAGLSLIFMLVSVLSIQAVVVAQSDLGTEANPIEVFFVPSVEAQTITAGGEVMAAALKEATGLTFKVSVPTSYAATVEAMCAAPGSSIGFIPAAGYVIANNRCGVEVSLAAVRNGWNVYWTEYIVRRDSDIYTFGDLAGKSWAYPDAASTSGYIVPSVELQQAGITVGEEISAGGHNQVVQAVYNGDADFGTTFFSPPVVPGAPWAIGDSPEPYDLTVDQSSLSADGSQLLVGKLEVLDARRNIRDTAPDVIEQVRILRLSAPIPNDTLSFGAEFPAELKAQIITALEAFAQTDAWAESIGNEDFYGWSGIAPVEDSAYDPVRARFDILGLTEEDVFN
ncbi:MAG: phosphate/phosphite/phosphonate ABC transporter substrate-binding protein [Chloroflexi bacterium]|nr:phosphate/phosphite/phosphonate ABC transporter substrate-binding protein [Chloroflexota bacterium]MCC6896119.1 phosphate/phosphite/phosphonate ABC transporter substrate-binding protein [Anaerolineae bacterium]